ncbi:TRAP transporter substrate-binding protein DctP [Tomitella gaofuii]|uniref:TRAP transporter substrate-binding protein n=1 Tax=Tomitella gaofuii TaxID=2760083 RepID=UPI0015FE6F1E|nr:TRAP transporter substrate-binding protein DctP [Tomitella gaofuii]
MAAAIAGCVALTACGAPGLTHNDEGQVVLTMADSFSTTHPIGRSGTKVFRDALRANGPDAGMELKYFPSGQLGKQSDMPALLRTGVAQIAAVSPAYVSSQLPLSNVGDLPGFTQDACVAADAMRALMQPGTTLFETELKKNDVHPLWVAVVPAYEAMSGDFPIRSAADLHGKIIRSTGGVADRVVDAAGAAGVSMPLGDLYEAISRGTVAGTLASPMSVTPYKLEEVLHYSTEGARLGSFTATYSISQHVWEQLDAEQRAVLTDASNRAQQAGCEEINRAVVESKQQMRDAGVQMDPVTEETRPAWEAITEQVQKSWVRDLASTGLPAQKVLDEAKAAFAAAEEQQAGEAR